MRRSISCYAWVASFLLMTVGFSASSLEAGTHHEALRPEAVFLKAEGDHLLRKGSLPDAISKYEKALRIEPGYANAHYNLATAYYLTRDLERAALSLEKFLELVPDDAEAHYNLACLKIYSEDLAGAKRHFLAACRCVFCPVELKSRINEALGFVRDLENESASLRTLILYFLGNYVEAR